jgi:hypothetical protein
MKVFPGSSFLQITQGVGTPARASAGGETRPAGGQPGQFAAQLRTNTQVQPVQQIRPSGPAPRTPETVRADGPQPDAAPPRDIARGSIINIKV